MRLYIGVTDNSWYKYLSQIKPEDINFWQPGGKTDFKILAPGGPFLFKLKSPINKIAGIGFFAKRTSLPINMAWEVFGNRNGSESFDRFKSMILNYRSDNLDNPTIGCIVLTNPIFFNPEDWLDVPQDWGKSIVQGKSYDLTEGVGSQLWQSVQLTLKKYLNANSIEGEKSQLTLENDTPQYGASILTKVRLGQGAFRILVTDAFTRRCSISGERTLPVLEAAHIKPYSKSGPHFISNSLLLRSDLHKLFDTGYITITKQHKIEVSKRIKEEFENGKEYYQYHGQPLKILPEREMDKPNNTYVEWHNSFFKG